MARKFHAPGRRERHEWDFATGEEDFDAAWGTLGAPTSESGVSRLLHVVHTPDATLRHAFYGEGAIVPSHRHPCGILVYGVGGPCLEASPAGDLIKRRLTYHPPGYEHSVRYLGPTHVMVLEIGELLGGTLAGRPQSMPLPATAYDLLWRVMLQIVRGEGLHSTAEAITRLLEHVFEFIRRPPSARMLAVINDLHLNWREVPSAKKLSTRFGVSPQYLCRAFKQATGVTLQQYGLLLRVDYARGLLWGSNMPLAEVASETGFADQSHLSRALAAHSAVSPLRFRWHAPCREGAPGAPDFVSWQVLE